MGLFGKRESFIALDIGSSAVKLVELNTATATPTLVNVGIQPLPSDVFSGNMISQTDVVAEQINTLLEANEIAGKRVVIAMPGSSVFTKRIQIAKMGRKDLTENIQFEAGNYIPHNIDAVKVDYHIIGEAGKNQLDVLLVAVKNEIIDSYLDALAIASLETAVVDVDYFAVQNMFELAHPELVGKTVALINIGARFSAINICKGGNSLFCGDVSVGGSSITDEIAEATALAREDAEKLKVKPDKSSPHHATAIEIIDRNTEQIASELNRQLSFFWNAAGAEEGIDRVMLCGGGALLPGLVDELSTKTGIECAIVEPLRGIEHGESFEQGFLNEISQLVSVGLGLATREPGDKIYPEWIES